MARSSGWVASIRVASCTPETHAAIAQYGDGLVIFLLETVPWLKAGS